MKPDANENGAEQTGGRAVTPVYLALRDGIRRFIARRVRPEHVDDLVQDVLLRMHERAGDLHDEARLPGWAFRIAQSVVADHHRRKRPEVPCVPGQAGVEAEEHEPADEDEAGNVNEIVAGWLRPMLALLPAEYEEALELVDVQGLGQREYAERAGLSFSGAKSRVQRGRRMLEEIVRACCDLETDTRGNVIGYERRNCGCGGDENGAGGGGCVPAKTTSKGSS
ncbi:MAG: sigma-70 family RNA polymerase sigma factor [Deltaproteobacteria bacterium]|nr:sigma-70 family RNA polymerase sigma factor [Deltaproteobacteria bacterium]